MFKVSRSVNSLWYQSAASFTRVRRAKTFKLTQYPVIPPWAQLHEKDAFEYKLRSKAELLEEEKKCPPNFPIKLIYVDYPQARFETTDKARKMKLELNMDDMNLTTLQRKRLIHLIGPRYKGSSIFRISSDMYSEWEDNLVKCLEISRELYWEAKRAP